jgi:hypothetical protein
MLIIYNSSGLRTQSNQGKLQFNTDIWYYLQTRAWVMEVVIIFSSNNEEFLEF